LRLLLFLKNLRKVRFDPIKSLETRFVQIPIETNKTVNPVELRSVFGANLRKLASRYPSVAGLCRELGINRTQFNRYLAAESFPRPDVLHRICLFFDVDARILLEPVDDIGTVGTDPFNHPAVKSYLGKTVETVSESELPNGFYRFSRPSFVNDDLYVLGLMFVFRSEGRAFLRGYELPEAMNDQGLPISAYNREFRGVILKQEQGLVILAARRGATTCSFSYLARVPSFHNNFWEGYATRTVTESLTGHRVARFVIEHIQGDWRAARAVARESGFCSAKDLPGYHARLMRVGQPFR
jgi:hypothetical protein